MKKDIATWLNQIAASSGMLVVGMSFAANKCHCRSNEDKYPVEKIEKLLHQFSMLHAPLPATEFSPRWTTWQFEYGWFRFVPHPDRSLLLMVAAPESEAARELDQFTADFLTLSFK